MGVAVTLTAFFYLRYTENEQAHEALETEAYSLQRDIRQSLVSHLFVAELLAREWERSEINLNSRRSADADIVTLYYPNVQNVVWLDDSQTIQFLYPKNEQTALVGSVFSGSSLNAQLSQSQNNRHAMMGDAGNLGQLSSDIAIFVRVQRSDTPGFLGFVISLQSMFNNVIRTNISEGFQVSISNDSGVLDEFAGDSVVER